MQQGCKDRCLAYLRRHAGEWIPKGRICDLARTHGGYTGETTNRRLRELHVEGHIVQEIRKGHVWYKFDDSLSKRLSADDWDEI